MVIDYMQDHFLGVTFALLAALVWAFAVILFKMGGEKTHPLALNLFKNNVAIICLVATLLFLGNWLGVIDETFKSIKDISTRNIWILALSGFLGITLADTLFFYSLNIIGVGLTAIIDCLYSPVTVLFSWLFLSEKLTTLQYFGGILIVSAVVITSGHKPQKGLTRKRFVTGIVLAVICKILMAAGIVMMKPILDCKEVGLIWATIIRTLTGTVTLMIVIMAMPQRKILISVFKPSRHWFILIPGSILGAYLALLFWMAGFRYTDVSIAAVLNQTTTIISIVLATLILKEVFTRRKLLAVILAMTGIILVAGNGDKKSVEPPAKQINQNPTEMDNSGAK